jgi:glycosyltransferase involved in cell wall biosynthesis
LFADAHADCVRVRVVIPAYNAAPWIGGAIASLLAQTHEDWTLVVVDDGSTDGTSEVVGGFSDLRIRLIRQANAGVSAARNCGADELCRTAPSPHPPPARGGGVAACVLPRPLREGVGGRGDSVLYLDADDLLAPDALSRLVAALDASPSAVAAIGAYAFVDTAYVRHPPSGDTLRRLLVGNLFANGGHLLVRSEAIRAVGGFLPGIAYGEDWEFWIRIALRGPFVAAPGRMPVLFVRQQPGGAYHRLAADPAAFTPCMEAIFSNPALLARFGPRRLAAIRRRTEAENDWIIGRELIRHNRGHEGLVWLRCSVRAAFSVKRAVLFAAAHMLPLLPPAWRGPFRPYPRAGDTRANFVCSVPITPAAGRW